MYLKIVTCMPYLFVYSIDHKLSDQLIHQAKRCVCSQLATDDIFSNILAVLKANLKIN